MPQVISGPLIAVAILMQLSIACNVMAQDDPLTLQIQRARALRDSGEVEKALLVYDSIQSGHSHLDIVHYDMAVCYFDMGQFKRARREAHKASKTRGEVGLEADLLIGNCYDQEGKPRKSIRHYDKALRRYGDFYATWYNKGISQLHEGDVAQAAASFRRAIVLNRDDYNAHKALAYTEVLMKRPSRALLSMYFCMLLRPTGSSAEAMMREMTRLMQGTELEVQADQRIRHVESASYVDMIPLPGWYFEKAKSIGETDDRIVFCEAGRQWFLAIEQTLQMQVKGTGRADDEFLQEQYLALFVSLAGSEHYDAFCHYITQGSNAQSALWVSQHFDDLSALFEWLDDQKL